MDKDEVSKVINSSKATVTAGVNVLSPCIVNYDVHAVSEVTHYLIKNCIHFSLWLFRTQRLLPDSQ